MMNMVMMNKGEVKRLREELRAAMDRVGELEEKWEEQRERLLEMVGPSFAKASEGDLIGVIKSELAAAKRVAGLVEGYREMVLGGKVKEEIAAGLNGVSMDSPVMRGVMKLLVFQLRYERAGALTADLSDAGRHYNAGRAAAMETFLWSLVSAMPRVEG